MDKCDVRMTPTGLWLCMTHGGPAFRCDTHEPSECQGAEIVRVLASEREARAELTRLREENRRLRCQLGLDKADRLQMQMEEMEDG